MLNLLRRRQVEGGGAQEVLILGFKLGIPVLELCCGLGSTASRCCLQPCVAAPDHDSDDHTAYNLGRYMYGTPPFTDLSAHISCLRTT